MSEDSSTDISTDLSTESSSGSTVCIKNKFTDLLKKKEKIASMSEDSSTNSSTNSSTDSSSSGSTVCSDSRFGSTVCIANKFTDLFKKKEKIGSGGFGSVYRCLHILEKKEYAVKRIKLKNNKKEFEWYLREVRAMSSLEHKNVVRYYQSWTDLSWDGFSSSNESDDDNEGQSDSKGQSDLYLFIQMEYCPRTLESILAEKPIDSHEALVYLHDLLQGLDYVHSSGYLHRDLAKKNIFIGKDKNIKIGDFGLAKKLIGPADEKYCSHSPHSTNIGIGFHPAPELLENQPYTKKSDMYGVGIIFLEMLLPPMDTAHERFKAINDIKKGLYPEGWNNTFETDILRRLLADSPEARPYADELIELISDEIEERNENARE